MSFILDALKKSENERQRHVGPSLADVRISHRERERPWWAFAVAGLLVVNLGVLAVVLLRGDAEPATAPAPTMNAAPMTPASSPPASPPAPAAPAYIQPQQVNPAVRSLADEAGVPDDSDVLTEEIALADGSAAAAPEGAPLVRRIEPGGSSSVVRAEATAGNQEVLPTHNDLTVSGTALPDLHLDIHVHSTNPAERFVFVNMRKYVEGQTLSEGPAVERITPAGVILNHRGLRFLLSRQ